MAECRPLVKMIYEVLSVCRIFKYNAYSRGFEGALRELSRLGLDYSNGLWRRPLAFRIEPLGL